MKIIQVNLGRRRAAHDLLHATVLKEKIDIALICEPNKKITSGPKGWIKDVKGDVAAYIYNKRIQVTSVSKKEGYVGIKLENGLTIYCCYISPNIRMSLFENQVDSIMEDARSSQGNYIICGDLNAKATEWGSPITDGRGRYMCEWIASENLVVHNDGGVATCCTANGESHIDITLSKQRAARSIASWKVSEAETLSDHRYILFEVLGGKNGGFEQRQVPRVDWVKFRRVARDCMGQTDHSLSAEQLTKLTKGVQDSCTIKRGNTGVKVPYWWSLEIEAIRENCILERRKQTRLRRGGIPLDGTQELSNYKRLKKKLNKEIRLAKRDAWNRLCNQLNDDVWGQGYRIAMWHLGGLRPEYSITREEKGNCISAFPRKRRHMAERADRQPTSAVYRRGD